MHDQLPPRGPVIVTLPTEIDLINQDRAYDQLCAALASGADIVIADFTATTWRERFYGIREGAVAVVTRRFIRRRAPRAREGDQGVIKISKTVLSGAAPGHIREQTEGLAPAQLRELAVQLTADPDLTVSVISYGFISLNEHSATDFVSRCGQLRFWARQEGMVKAAAG
jgi:hypothetical protein